MRLLDLARRELSKLTKEDEDGDEEEHVFFL